MKFGMSMKKTDQEKLDKIFDSVFDTTKRRTISTCKEGLEIVRAL